jgi:NAD(P)-dependent dehydrogenase (short-subunit alcohol dehydrogenase family)
MSKSILDLSKEFAGRRALVTGGSRGIGAAIGQRLLDAGATVAVTARSRHEQTPKNATFFTGDILTYEGARKIGEEALRILGGLDILVNNAAAARVHLPNSEAIPDDEWVDAVNSNYLSAVRVTKALLPALRQSKSGTIINISSGGVTPFPGPLMHYGAAKAALNAYSRALAKELAPVKIRVNIVTPGGVVTPGGDVIRKNFMDALKLPAEAAATLVPLGRLGQPEEIAEMVAYLASDRASWITGHNYYVDGGMAEL